VKKRKILALLGIVIFLPVLAFAGDLGTQLKLLKTESLKLEIGAVSMESSLRILASKGLDNNLYKTTANYGVDYVSYLDDLLVIVQLADVNNDKQKAYPIVKKYLDEKIKLIDGNIQVLGAFNNLEGLSDDAIKLAAELLGQTNRLREIYVNLNQLVVEK